MASFAPGLGFDGDSLLDAGKGFLEAELEVVAQVGSARRVLARAARIHELAEDGREDVGKTVEAAASKRVVAAAVLERGLAEAVIGRALLRVLEHVIGFVDGLETRLGILAAVLTV